MPIKVVVLSPDRIYLTLLKHHLLLRLSCLRDGIRAHARASTHPHLRATTSHPGVCFFPPTPLPPPFRAALNICLVHEEARNMESVVRAQSRPSSMNIYDH